MTNASNLFNNFEPLDIAKGKLKNTQQLWAYGRQIAANPAGEINANDTGFAVPNHSACGLDIIDAGPHDGLNRGWS